MALDSGSPNLLPPGSYRARAVASHYDLSSQKLTPFAKITFEIIEGPEKGRQIDWIGYLSEKTMERTVESLRNCGYAGNNPEELSNCGPNAIAGLLPREVQIVTQHKEFRGSVSDEVRWVNEVGQSGGDMLDAIRAAFAAKPLGSKARGGAGGHAIPRPAPAGAVKNEDADDDIPF